MIESAYGFVGAMTIFPVLFILVFAAVFAMGAVGIVLFVNGLKSKWKELNNAKRVLKIVAIVFGVLFIMAAIFMVVYVSVGFAELSNRGGIFGNANRNSSRPTQTGVILNYLEMLI